LGPTLFFMNPGTKGPPMRKSRNSSDTSNPRRGDPPSKDLMQVALGEKKASLVIQNGQVLNVYTRELLEGWSIAVLGKKIACVGKDLEYTIGKKTAVIDATHRTVIPGFIDGHTHLAWIFNTAAFLNAAMRGGTTTYITETMEPFPVAGLDGMMDFMASTRNQPVKIYVTAPAAGSISSTARGIPLQVLRKLLKQPSILGFGESYWQGVLQTPEAFLPAYAETLGHGKVIEGHSAGARGPKLSAYAALGVSSCHEPITAQEVLERLRLGLWVMIREGSIRRDLAAISTIKDAGIDLRRLILVTDGISPADLLEKGYMEYVVQKAIHCGFDPLEAVRMATLNAAEHFRIDDRVGGIAPGRYADLLLIPDIRTIAPEMVISNGRVILRRGKLLESARPHRFSVKSIDSIRIKRELTEKDFAVRAPKTARAAEVRVMELVTDLVTQERVETLPVEAGEVRMDPSRDILKAAALDRTHIPGKTAVGFVKGFRMREGAFASSAAWDTSDIIVVGVHEADMALAVNRIRELRGGAVVCCRGKIRAELPLPILGLMSDLPLKRLHQKLAAVQKAASKLGVPFPDPLLTLVTLTGAAIPFLRICEEGLVDLKEGKHRDLIVEIK